MNSERVVAASCPFGSNTASKTGDIYYTA